MVGIGGARWRWLRVPGSVLLAAVWWFRSCQVAALPGSVHGLTQRLPDQRCEPDQARASRAVVARRPGLCPLLTAGSPAGSGMWCGHDLPDGPGVPGDLSHAQPLRRAQPQASCRAAYSGGLDHPRLSVSCRPPLREAAMTQADGGVTGLPSRRSGATWGIHRGLQGCRSGPPVDATNPTACLAGVGRPVAIPRAAPLCCRPLGRRPLGPSRPLLLGPGAPSGLGLAAAQGLPNRTSPAMPTQKPPRR